MIVTWCEDVVPPPYEQGLPDAIHFWKCMDNLYLLRNSIWHLWRPGVAIKDVGL